MDECWTHEQRAASDVRPRRTLRCSSFMAVRGRHRRLRSYTRVARCVRTRIRIKNAHSVPLQSDFSAPLRNIRRDNFGHLAALSRLSPPQSRTIFPTKHVLTDLKRAQSLFRIEVVNTRASQGVRREREKTKSTNKSHGPPCTPWCVRETFSADEIVHNLWTPNGRRKGETRSEQHEESRLARYPRVCPPGEN